MKMKNMQPFHQGDSSPVRETEQGRRNDNSETSGSQACLVESERQGLRLDLRMGMGSPREEGSEGLLGSRARSTVECSVFGNYKEFNMAGTHKVREPGKGDR